MEFSVARFKLINPQTTTFRYPFYDYHVLLAVLYTNIAFLNFPTIFMVPSEIQHYALKHVQMPTKQSITENILAFVDFQLMCPWTGTSYSVDHTSIQ